LTAVLRRHPVLARLLAQRCLDMTTAATELLTRLGADRPLLAGAVLPGGAPGPLARVDFGLGDPHDAARTVARLEFRDGRRLMYKPRPLGLHRWWNEFLAWFAHRRPGLAPRAVRVLPRAGYGWTEYVAAAPCGSPAAFYARTGAQLALLYAVDAIDIHAENVIASGDHPVVVDVETLFHPALASATDGGPDPAVPALAASVLRTSVLPVPLFGEHGAVDSSAIGGRAGQLSPDELPAWENPGTDLMRLCHRRAPWPGGPNRPVRAEGPGGRDGWSHGPGGSSPGPGGVDPADHAAELLHGFRSAYRALLAHRSALTAPGGLLERAAAEPVRLVVRPSQKYARLLTESLRPEALRDLAARRGAFGALFEDTGRPVLRALAPYEREQLLDGDIPLFTTTPRSRAVRSSRGDTIEEALPGSALVAVRAKQERLGEEDLRRQEWLLRASLAGLRPAAEHRTPGPAARPPLPAGDGAGTPAAGRALALAVSVGDQLLGLACAGDGRLNWPGLHLLDDRHWLVHAQGASLGDGYSGTALFLAELGRATGRARFSEAAAQAVVQPLPRTLRLLAAHPELAARVGPGGFHGVGGLVYAAARLGPLLDSRELLEVLPDAVTALTAASAAEERADVADGLAGGLLVMDALHAALEHAGLERAAATALERALTDRLTRAAPP
ncbi:type 2 lanthipeptide synthetase LanM family protein, partial [Streptomyces sp. SM12]|uniref:type 2 lanthipeptide synthetase LanM family protein n=2 Tax=unclassified Streptomyces TaxID=2593676 RepID=UPI000CD594CA